MLLLSKSIINQPILSIRTAGVIAQAVRPIYNPDNLKIVGFHCKDKFSVEDLILVSQDIRERSKRGFIVNDFEVLVQAADLVRLKDVIEIDYQLLGANVVTENRKKLGKVVDFSVDSETLYVQKLYVGQSILKNLSHGQLSIERNQIIEITDSKIIVKDPLQGTKLRAGVKQAFTSRATAG